MHRLLLFTAGLAPTYVDVSDSIALTDTPATEGTITVQDSLILSEIPQPGPAVSDSFALSDAASLEAYVYVSEPVLLIEVAHRVQGEISLDGIALPHVLKISVEEPSVLQDLPVMDALPYRKQRGKRGRSLRIQGWTDSLATLESLRAYDDGEKHFLILPTGESMYVHVTDVRTPENVEDYDQYAYEMEAFEVVD